MIQDYEKQVYASVLGKVIGVYLGRPYEGWSKEKIQETWGEISRYVHEERDVPLVVADDDISGTFTFIRALEDSGKYENTPDEFFGETWLNYLLEKQTILWWGGMSHSTEHTAFIRLKSGIKSPESGSMKLNGREVAEQIGAQIFIDAFGMVAPGKPELAARFAAQAAGVSHDGEAVFAAQVVAVMVSLAFVEKDMNRLLDEAMKFIPTDSLIAQVHRDVRKWASEFPDWNDTFAKIKENYGYDKYGGNCHVIPNHAIMVMAWAYGQADFYKSMCIVCSAGWDTDCNAGNVGSISALVAGLEHLNDSYEFQAPCADRILIPAADGTDSVCDVLRQAMSIAAIGRKIMKMPPLAAPKNGARFHFEMPGALHGFLAEQSRYETRGNACVSNVAAPVGFAGTRCLKYAFNCGPGIKSMIETPVSAALKKNWYFIVCTPMIYSGNRIQVKGKCDQTSIHLRMFIKLHDDSFVYSEPIIFAADGSFDFTWQAEFNGVAVTLGFESTSTKKLSGTVLIDSIALGGKVSAVSANQADLCGWISNMDFCRNHFSNDVHPDMFYRGKNTTDGFYITGNRNWGNVKIVCDFAIHAADRSGLVFNYQGVRRWNALLFTREKLQLVHNYYGERVLAEVPFAYAENQAMHVELSKENGVISAFVDGKKMLEVSETELPCGGAGMYVDTGLAGVRNLRLEAEYQ